MHQCCEQCFLQKNIREYINNRRRIGTAVIVVGKMLRLRKLERLESL